MMIATAAAAAATVTKTIVAAIIRATITSTSTATSLAVATASLAAAAVAVVVKILTAQILIVSAVFVSQPWHIVIVLFLVETHSAIHVLLTGLKNIKIVLFVIQILIPSYQIEQQKVTVISASHTILISLAFFG
jgi:hypothetical protein